MNTSEYYRGSCAVCGEDMAKRKLNKLFVLEGGRSCGNPRKLCFLCDRCLTDLLDHLGCSIPEESKRRGPYHSREIVCLSCFHINRADSKFCGRCGEKLTQKLIGKGENDEILSFETH